MKNISATFIVIFVIQGCSFFGSESPARKVNKEETYLRYYEDQLISMHGLNFGLKIPESYTAKPIINYDTNFNNHPFYVSFAPLISSDRFLSVHAEAVTDNSGYLNYSHLDEFKIDDILFYRKDQCVRLSTETVNSMNDLRYVKDLGFGFDSPVYLAQFFKHSFDGNKEYVLTFAQRVANCEGINELKKRVTEQIGSLIHINEQDT